MTVKRYRISGETSKDGVTLRGWDVIDNETGDTVPGHDDYDFEEDAQRAADELNEEAAYHEDCDEDDAYVHGCRPLPPDEE